MRQQTFRMWDSAKGKMIYFTLATADLIDRKTRALNTHTFMMGSGKLDKQDNEIFEGDFIYYKYDDVSERGEFQDSVKEITAKVIYEDSAFLLEITPFVKKYLREISLSDWTVREFKIVGNVHQLQTVTVTLDPDACPHCGGVQNLEAFGYPDPDPDRCTFCGGTGKASSIE
jgi:hypothetical protein